ncbi:MAG: M23 family metallopeptidase [Sphingobacteriales bacterium]|nr:MAG: M23 family metallopeptidase [Sphingobacteriales bacterium]
MVDNHTASCEDCSDDNNYVWIEHANNEWSKYTHMKRFSASVDAGLVAGDTICAGTFLGYECDIGAASGQHLHFELRRPNDPTDINISVNGGFMDRGDAVHLVPVINSNSKHYMEAGDTWTAGSTANCATTVSVPAQTLSNDGYKVYMATSAINTNSNSIILRNGGSAVFHSGGSITFTPGFSAEAGSYCNAKIGGCSTTAFPGGCN